MQETATPGCRQLSRGKGGGSPNKKKLLLKKNILYYQPQIMEELELKLANTPYEKYVYTRGHREKVIHLISTLCIKPIIDKRYDRTDFIHLSQKEFLAPMYGDHYYADIIRALKAAGVIEVDSRYLVGSDTKGYKLKDRYIDYPFERLPLPKTSLISRKMDAHRQQQESGPTDKKRNKQVYAKLERELENITIDYEGAKAFILEKMKRFLEDPSSVRMKRKSPFNKGEWVGIPDPPTEEECDMLLRVCEKTTGLSVCLSDKLTPKVLKRIVNIYESDMLAVQMIHDGPPFTFEVDKTSGRVHTNLTNLSSDLRKFIYLNAKEIKGSDLSNSQPLLLALILLDKFGRLRVPKDVNQYVGLCVAGKFYGALMEQDGMYFPSDDELKKMSQAEKDKFSAKKKKFKEDIFERIFFGNVPEDVKVPHFKVAKAFHKRFPNVWNFIIEVKSNKKEFGNRAHAQLAILLQKKEQDIMILKAARECLKRNIPILTLHDALYTTEDYINEVCEIILNQFIKNYGVEPKLSPA
jgi:hypothetical protein